MPLFLLFLNYFQSKRRVQIASPSGAKDKEGGGMVGVVPRVDPYYAGGHCVRGHFILHLWNA